jgi:hypothetical protein
MKEYAEMGETAPEDYPKIKDGICGMKPAVLEDTITELAEVEERIAEFEKQASEDADEGL